MITSETLIQGTKEWLEWRRQGVGASESPTLLGMDAYKNTPYKLWKEKTSPIPESVGTGDGDSNRAMSKGHEVEAKIRASYELDTGLDFQPCLMEFVLFPQLRASLDGWNDDRKQGVEIKYVSETAYESGIVPQHHMVQMQHQMLVAGVDNWTYLISNNGVHYKAIPVVADKDMQAKIIVAVKVFWHNVITGTPPPYTDEDWVPSQDMDLLDALTTGDRDAVFQLAKHNKTEIEGWKVDRGGRRIYKPKGK